MGNGEFQVPRHVTNQWSEVLRNNKKYLKNKITYEEFQLMVLQKLQETQEISLLIERSIYSIPRTPKIIILNDQKGELFILVQQCDRTLVQHLPKILLTVDILQLLSSALAVFGCLFKKYGPFEITEGMIGLNGNLEILAWINETKWKNHAQIPIQNTQNAQRAMVSQIVNIFKKYSRTLFWQEELQGYKGFDCAQKQLIKMIRKRKMEMVANNSQCKSRRDGLKRALSPQTSFGSFRNLRVGSPKAGQGSSKLCKRNVPNFLKRMTEKKINLLDSLHHKRTVTIDEVQKQIKSKEKDLLHLRAQNREKCSSKSLTKVKSLKATPAKDKNTNFSGEMSKASFPTSAYTEKPCDLLTQSGSSSNYLIKKRQFQDSAALKPPKIWKFQSFTPKNSKNSQEAPNSQEKQSNYWQINGQSCLFQIPQNNKPQSNISLPIAVNLKVPLTAMCNNTTESNYFNEPSKQKQPIIEEQSQCVSKTLEEQFNDFFSNPSKSPRFMLQALPQSNELTQQFSKIIDF